MQTEIDKIVDARIKQQQQDQRAQVRAEVERELATQAQQKAAEEAKQAALDQWAEFTSAWPARWQQGLANRSAALQGISAAVGAFMAQQDELLKLEREYDQQGGHYFAASGKDVGQWKQAANIVAANNSAEVGIALAVARMLIAPQYGASLHVRDGSVTLMNWWNAPQLAIVK